VTGTSETLPAQRSEIDLGVSLWTIPADRMKRDKVHRVPLPGPAIAVLEKGWVSNDPPAFTI
jgi:integrase